MLPYLIAPYGSGYGLVLHALHTNGYPPIYLDHEASSRGDCIGLYYRNGISRLWFRWFELLLASKHTF